MLLYSISNSIEFWLVNHTSIYESNELNIFKNIRFLGEILIIDQATYRQQMYTKLLIYVDSHFWWRYNGKILLP